MAFKGTEWHAAKFLLLFEFQVNELCHPSLAFKLSPKFRIELIYTYTQSMLTYTPNLYIPANQLTCEPNLEHVVSKAFGHSGLLMCASCFIPLILIPSITFICISERISLVNK